ncbi:MAG: hypothetical protein E4H08_08900 [Candidatus Atribacteria bacterium]|nr:MAG: hypothetical protein E4H08_08900 [Candidatus Atribacteria bacterium]
MDRTLFDTYDAGRIGEAMRGMRDQKDLPAAQALVALTENRPSDVLNCSVPSDLETLELRALAAFRCGEGAELLAISRRLSEIGAQTPLCRDLLDLAPLARLASGRRLRRITSKTPEAAAFDLGMPVPMIDVAVNGEVCRFIVDTGAEVSVIDDDVARRMGVRRLLTAGVSLDSNSGRHEVATGLIGELAILGLTMEDVPVLFAELSGLKEALHCVGILGVQDLLSEFVLILDYMAGQINLSEHSSDRGWPIYFVRGRAKIAVEGAMEGGSSGLFRIDTGSNCCELTDAYVDRALADGAAWDVSELNRVTAVAIGTAQERQERTLRQGWFRPAGGDTRLGLEQLPVGTWLPDRSIAYAGKLGGNAFRERILELDYPACRMRLRLRNPG